MGQGLINDTYRLEAGGRAYVLQRLNRRIFPRPERIMANLVALARHPEPPERFGLQIPALIATRDGERFTRDANGDVWRLMEFIPNSATLAGIGDARQAGEVGRVLGRFHRWVGAMPVAEFELSLPDFHATPRYLERLFEYVAARAPVGAGGEVAPLIAFVNARRALADVLESASRAGRIVRRVTHGDPKLDNILFDSDGRRALALIDLDTVQPGLIQHDLGDCLRSCCNARGESDEGGEGVSFDLDVCGWILAGYAEETRDLLNEADIACLYDALRLLPFELGVRFLTDHLDGDRYFKVERPGQNLLKARIQFALVADIERKERVIRAMIGDLFEAAA